MAPPSLAPEATRTPTMTDRTAPAGASLPHGLDHREVFARFVDRLAGRLAEIRSRTIERTA